jgi:site-specific DNA-methyltransferase (cytosine-N4-specific)
MPALHPDASVVLEMGNAWVPGHPAMSTLPLRALLGVQERLGLSLCQELIWHNPARLPGPAQWVNVERIRLKDTFTRLWWLSKSSRPKADNRTVLQKYGSRMSDLLSEQRRTTGLRPSQHRIGERGFLSDNGGAIPSNVLTYANTASSDPYLDYCTQRSLPRHPARMPIGLAEFLIRLLTEKGDLVLDPFAGSNTTGRAAENLGRRWVSVEIRRAYVQGSVGRFLAEKPSVSRLLHAATRPKHTSIYGWIDG